MDALLLPAWAVGVLGALSLAVVVLVVLHLATRVPRFDLAGRVVLVTGGSSGIGKATAHAALARGASVALVARREAVLLEAAAELAAAPGVPPAARITTHAADVGDEASCGAAVRAAAAAHGGRLDVLVNSAGVSGPRRFEEATAADFESTFRINVLGSRNAILAALPFMGRPAPATPGRAAGGAPCEGGRIVLVSSQAGQTGLYGYTAYSASKFALRGLFESLSQELHMRRVRVSLVFPPDTDTPMLAAENESKPALTRLLSEASATVPPQAVAAAIIAGVQQWRPFISVGFDGWMLSTVTSGLAPCGDVLTGAVQVATMGLWRLVGLAYTQYFYAVISRHDQQPPAGAAAPGAAPAAASAAAGAGGAVAASAASARRRRGASGSAAGGASS